MTKISVYATKVCPNCNLLKQLLKEENIQYEEINMATPEGLTELRMNNVFAMSSPVLQIDNKFFTTKELCKQDILDVNKVRSLLKGKV